MARSKERPEGGVATKTATARRLQRPIRHRVLLHNDHYTTQEFVVRILETVFHRDPQTALRLMLEVHERGVALAGVYPREIAESKAAVVRELARREELPFLCTTEPEG